MSTPRPLFAEEHGAFRQTVRRFLEREAVPHNQECARAGIVSREVVAQGR